MELYLAPLEGITTYTYRNTHAELFGGCDAYYAPFVVPTDNERLSAKNLRDITPENNRVNLKVQVMCSSSTAFDKFVGKIKEMGYNEANLNFGCPSGTVVKKGRGSGALRDTEALDGLLDGIFETKDIKISVKTRAGYYSHEEFDTILDIYKKYPISEVIVHPRVREELYRGEPNLDSFKKAYDIFGSRVCYNGNIYSVDDYRRICEKFPDMGSVMIGRGCIRNPAIFREINGGKRLTTAELIYFSNTVEKRYLELFASEENTLYKLKEIWMYAITNYPEETKITKAVKKAKRLADFNSAINALPEIV